MASNQKNAFPFFVPNQILRSSTLNEYFAFLDEQTRLSRVRLWGCGIVDGLDFSYEDGVLVINPGVAVNCDGWLVQVPERVEYRYGAEIAYSTSDFRGDNLKELAMYGGSHVSMICFRDEDDAMHAGLKQPVSLSKRNLDDFIVALAYGKRPEYDSLCSHDLCDVNTSAQILEAWPVLIPKNEVSSLFQRLSPLSLYLPPRREPAIECFHGDIEAFGEQIISSALSWKTLAREGIDRLSAFFEEFDTPVRNCLFSDNGELLDRLKKAYDHLDVLRIGKRDVWQEYLFSFFRDMVTALNEFIEEYNTFVDKHEYIPNTIPFDHLTYLGLVGKQETADKDVYRSVFRNALDEEFRKDRERLAAMLGRICVLSESVKAVASLEWLSKQPFRLERVRAGGRLSSRPVPFYYDAGEDFYRFWNADNHYLDKLSFDDKYQYSSGSMCDDGVLFFPSSYQGKDLEVVKNEFETLNSQSRLAVDVEEAKLNVYGLLPSGSSSSLLSLLQAITKNSTAPAFFETVREQCPDGAAKLAGALKDSFDANLIQSLTNGKPLSGESYRGILEIEKIDGNDVDVLAKKIFTALKTKPAKMALSDCVTSLLSLFHAWQGSFIGTNEGVSPEEIGKAISMAPIRRGSRVFLFTVPEDGNNEETLRKVVSYSVLYRNHAESVAKAQTGMLLFRLRTQTAENDDYASDFPDTVNPYEDGRWEIDKNNQIVFYPYLLDGMIAKRYEMAKADISCDVSDPDILQYSIEEEKRVPAIYVKMIQNGTAWVTLQIKDAKGALLYYKTLTLVVNNPAWRVVPLTGISIEPSSLEYYLGEAPRQFVIKRIPEDATNANEMKWNSTNSGVAKVSSTGLVTGVKEGSAEIVVTCPNYPSVSRSVKVYVSSIVFKMQGSDGKFVELTKRSTVRPFQDAGKWDVTENEMLICPFKNDGTVQQQNPFIPNPESSELCSVSCTIDERKILTYEKVLVGPNGTTPAIKLKMMGKTGPANVTLAFYKGTVQIAETSFKVLVSNAEWDRTHVESVSLGTVPNQLYMGQSLTLKPKLVPKEVGKEYDDTVFWDSDNDKVAKVADDGTVKPVGLGSTTITVKTKDGGKTASVKLQVLSLLFRGKSKSKPKEVYVDIGDSIDVRDTWPNLPYVEIYAFEDDGVEKRVLKNDSIRIIEDPDRVGRGPSISLEDNGGIPYAKVPWPMNKQAPNEASLVITDAKKGTRLYSKSFKLIV